MAELPGLIFSGATTTSFAITAAVAQNGYMFRCVVTGSCGPVNSNAAILTVNPLPDVTIGSLPNTICISDDAITLTASLAGGTWSGPGVQGNQFNPAVAGTGLKTISYTITVAGCTTVKTALIQVNECTERHLLLDAFTAVYVYPNPNNGQFSIRLNTDLYKRIGLKVFAADGKLVKTQVYSGVSYGSIISVDISNMPSGTYQLYIYNDEGEFIKKAVSIIVFK
ncbi:MAG: T9SS type A sorting domain-containing protein [Chitinophagaceae bacterium]